MALTYSRFFKVKHRDFVKKGVYNAFLDQDSLLHIDPLLLKGSEIPEFKNAYTEFFNYFRLFIPLVKASKADNLQDRFFNQMVKRFTFKEIPNTGLGFSKGNTRGRGISGTISIQLAHSAYTIIKAGIEDPEIFGLMQLIEDNMAADRISDMAIAILQRHFLEYTQRIALEMGLTTHSYTFEYGVMFQIPFYKDKPIHFIPESFLANLPVAHDFEEIDNVCNYNNRLKRKIGRILSLAIKIVIKQQFVSIRISMQYRMISQQTIRSNTKLYCFKSYWTRFHSKSQLSMRTKRRKFISSRWQCVINSNI